MPAVEPGNVADLLAFLSRPRVYMPAIYRTPLGSIMYF